MLITYENLRKNLLILKMMLRIWQKLLGCSETTCKHINMLASVTVYLYFISSSSIIIILSASEIL